MRIVLAMWVLASIAACRKDSGPSVDELRPKLEGLRTRIAKYATTLPDVQPIPVPGKLDPPIMFRNGAGGRTVGDNAEVFDFDGLVKGRDSVWEHSALMGAFDSPDHTSKADLEQALATRYLIVIKRTERVTPILSAGVYTPGKLAARVYVVDLASDKPLAVFDTSATTPESIKVEAVVNAKAGAEAQTEAAMTAARLKLSDELRASLRGNIQSALAPLGKANVYENPNAVD